MKRYYILIIFLAFAIQAMFSQTRIAVFAIGDLQEERCRLLSDQLVEAFAESDKYIAINRQESLNKLVSIATKYQETGRVDFTQAVNATKQYGESQLCAVDVYSIDDMKVFRATVLDVEKNIVVKTASVAANKDDINYIKLLEISKRLSNRIIGDNNSLYGTYDNDLAELKKRDSIDKVKQAKEERLSKYVQANTKSMPAWCFSLCWSAGYPWNMGGSVEYFHKVGVVGLSGYLNVGGYLFDDVNNHRYNRLNLNAGLRVYPYRGFYAGCGYGYIVSKSTGLEGRGIHFNAGYTHFQKVDWWGMCYGGDIGATYDIINNHFDPSIQIRVGFSMGKMDW